MAFLEIALRNAARGFRVHPLKTKGKAPLLPGWPELATTDTESINRWSTQCDANANCGVAAGPDLCILESDNVPELEKMLGAPVPHTYTVQAREGRPHFYFRPTDKTKQLGT